MDIVWERGWGVPPGEVRGGPSSGGVVHLWGVRGGPPPGVGGRENRLLGGTSGVSDRGDTNVSERR